ncbi:MAG: DUF262 domain-containing protein [Peptococcaceae bacterium]|nr:DUF262 domain-containing protein [Peptococcaceae bacterium]
MLQLESFVVSIAEFFLIDRENEPNFDNNRKNYVIPKYQREYTWTTEKVQTLISDINNRDKFLGNIILNKVPNYYEIVDGQQRITTIFLILIALFNQNRLPNSKALSAEQHDILRYLYNEHHPVLLNESIGDYFELVDNTITIRISDEDDIYYQKDTFTTLYEIILDQLSSIDLRNFQNKLLDSEFLVLIGDTQKRHSNSIEEVFLDINFKSQLLDVADVFKGYCFKNYTPLSHDDLKQLWTEVRKYKKQFERIGYSKSDKETCQYIYHYLLSRPETYSIPANLSIAGKHYLENKSQTQTMQLLTDMACYGKHIITLIDNLNKDNYIFDDLCSDAGRYGTDSVNHQIIKRALASIILYPNVQYYKLPIFMIFHYIMSNSELKAAFTYINLKKLVSNYYAYAFFFISNSKNKNKSSIDHTIFTELYRIDDGIAANEVIEGIINATKTLRKHYLSEYVQFNMFSKEKAYALYSLMDNYIAKDNYIGNIYCSPEYTVEHLIAHDNKKLNIIWDEENNEISFSLKELLGVPHDGKTCKAAKYRKTTANYLIIPSELNADLKKKDIVKKIKMIREYYNRHNINLPKHVETILSHIEQQPEYISLQSLKGAQKKKEEIKEAYKNFVNAYFSDEQQRILYEKLQSALQSTFENH